MNRPTRHRYGDSRNGFVHPPERSLRRLGRVKDLLAYRYPAPAAEVAALERQPVRITLPEPWPDE